MAKEHFDAGSGGGAMLESAKPVLELAVSLIHDIQAEAIDATSSVTALLRKCKLLAARLDHAELAQWVGYELGGYPNGAALPPYRLATPMSYGNFAGAFGARAENIQIPVEVLPEHLQEHYEHALWKPALKRVFPDKSLTRAAVATQLEAIYQSRNRIAHHEPVYGRRLVQTEAAIDFVARHLGNRGHDGATPLEKLLELELNELKVRADAMRQRLAALQAGEPD